MSSDAAPPGGCPQCGRELPRGATSGVCPACALGAALAAGPEGPDTHLLSLHDIPLPGESVAYIGDYELLDVIAQGGMGVVYRARQRSLDRVVALKLLIGGMHASEEYRRRFRQEAETAARLQHPNIVPVYEVGEHKGLPFFSMEYVAGKDLGELTRGGPLSAKRAAGYAKTVAEAIDHAHQAKVLHRDLKPSNILIGTDDRPRVTDFGLARRMDGASSLSLSGAVLGTPGYMSPEQASGKPETVGPLSDVYGLGAILYHLFTGRPPFAAGSVPETLRRVAETDPVSPRSLNPAVPRDLETICLRCLEKEPGRRYAHARAVAQELQRWLNGEPIQARRISPVERCGKWVRRNPRLALASALAALALLAGIIASGLISRQGEHRERAAAVHTGVQEAEEFLEQGKTDLGLGSLGRAGSLALALPRDPTSRMITERLVNLMTRRAIIVPEGKPFAPGAVRAVFVSAGSRVATVTTNASGYAVEVWADATNRIASVDLGPEEPRDLALSESGRFLAVGTAQGCWIWDVPARQRLLRLPGTEGEILQVQYHAAAQSTSAAGTATELLFVVSMDRAALWSVGSWSRLREFGQGTNPVQVAALSPAAEYVAVAGEAPWLSVWSAASGQQLGFVPKAHDGLIRGLRFSPDGQKLVTSSDDHTARIWRTPQCSSIGGEARHSLPVFWADFDPSGRWLATASADGQAAIWGVGGALERVQSYPHPSEVDVARFSGDGRWVFTACLDGRLRVWRPQDGKPVAEFKPAVPMAPFTTPELSPDGRQFLLVLDGGNGVQRCRLAGPAAPVGFRSSLPAVRSTTNLVTLGKLPAGLAARHEDILWADLSPDGRRIAIAPRGSPAQIVEAAPPHRLVSALPPQNVVNCIRFSPDGRRVATSAADHRIRVWDTDTGLALTDWLESAEPEREVAFTTDGSAVVSSSGQVLPIAVFDGPTPVWLPALAEALANASSARTDGAPSEPSDAIGDLRRSLASLPGGDPLVAWARQLLNPPIP